MPLQIIVGILKTAIAAEQHGFKSYLEFATKTANKSGKNMFITLATDEIAHMELLMGELEIVVAGQSVTGGKIERSAVASLVPRLSKVDKTLSGGGVNASERVALKTAIALELKASEYYRSNAERMGSDELKSIFEQLAVMEDGHYKVLQNELDSIEQNNYWLNIPEFNLEGE